MTPAATAPADTAPAAAAPHLVRLLDVAERERLTRFVRAEDQARYLAAHALARLVLAPELGIPAEAIRFSATCARCGGPHGKPAVAGHPDPPELSLSHSGDRVAVAVTRCGPVGVDVELAIRVTAEESLAHHVLSPAERTALAGLPADRRQYGLLTYWTRKEALLKATGDGLSVPLDGVTVSPPGQAPRLLSWTSRPELTARAHLADLDPGQDHLGCVAVLAAARPRIVEHDATALLTERS